MRPAGADGWNREPANRRHMLFHPRPEEEENRKRWWSKLFFEFRRQLLFDNAKQKSQGRKSVQGNFFSMRCRCFFCIGRDRRISDWKKANQCESIVQTANLKTKICKKEKKKICVESQNREQMRNIAGSFFRLSVFLFRRKNLFPFFGRNLTN